MNNLDAHLYNHHYLHRSNWLRAAVLGANDGILSIASLAIGVAAATGLRTDVLVAALAGLVAGALSMAAGEFVSVSSQKDIEDADIEREKIELIEMPEIELQRLADIYENRGLKKETALLVATELSEKDALAAHIRDELGINENSRANPFEAALASGLAFTLGGLLPFMVAAFMPIENLEWFLYGFSMLFLMILGASSAKIGGSSISKAITRITLWGTLAMGVTALIGYLFGTTI